MILQIEPVPVPEVSSAPPITSDTPVGRYLEGLGKLRERPYSIVSAPHENELEFFFELVPPGDLTPLLYKLQPGHEVALKKREELLLRGPSA